MKEYGVEHASQNKDVKIRVKQYFLETYRVDNPSKAKSVKSKRKATFAQNYEEGWPSELMLREHLPTSPIEKVQSPQA